MTTNSKQQLPALEKFEEFLSTLVPLGKQLEFESKENSICDILDDLQTSIDALKTIPTIAGKYRRRELRERQNTCPACLRITDKFVTHHWFETIGGEDHEINICPSCNSMLSTKNFYEPRYYKEHKDSLHHVLPCWDEQLKWLRTHTPPPKDGWPIEWYRGYQIIRLPASESPTIDGQNEGEPPIRLPFFIDFPTHFETLEDARLFLDILCKNMPHGSLDFNLGLGSPDDPPNEGLGLSYIPP